MRKPHNSDVRRLLVITYHFPPDGAIGGQRWAGLSKYLARLGWEVHVVTAAAAGGHQPALGVHRHFRPRRRTLNDAYKALAGRLRRRTTAPGHSPSEDRPRPRSFSPMRPISAVRRIVGSSMFLPDDGRGWVGAAASEARALLTKHQFDAVVTSGPPHSAHFAGLVATIGKDAQHWIDMRDPWSSTHDLTAPNDWFVRGERLVLRLFERLIFPRATRVIVNTPQFASRLSIAEPGLDVRCLLNGVDLEQVPARDATEVVHGSVAYIGTLYAGRNLSSVCAAMRLLLGEAPGAAESLRLNVAGPMETPHRRQFEQDIAVAGLTSMVKIHGLLPREDALALLSRSHLSLVLAQGQPMQIPAKLYESVALGVPTLVIAEEESAAACEARRIGAMTVDTNDVDRLRSILKEMLDGGIPTKVEPKMPISYAHLALEWDSLLRGARRTESEELPRSQPASIPSVPL
jgi:glycosyltransferase involved in cell wall biosynthesis